MPSSVPFSLQNFQFFMQESVVFIDISTYCIKHELTQAEFKRNAEYVFQQYQKYKEAHPGSVPPTPEGDCMVCPDCQGKGLHIKKCPAPACGAGCFGHRSLNGSERVEKAENKINTRPPIQRHIKNRWMSLL